MTTDAPFPPRPGPFLVLDAAMPTLSVGIWEKGRWRALETSDNGALETLTAMVRNCLCMCDCSLADIKGFLYCEGPGSLLSLRVAVMALRTWQSLATAPPPIYAYRSLELAARALLHIYEAGPDFAILAPARRRLWWHLPCRNGATAELREISSEKAHQLSSPLYYLPQRKAWQAPPPHAAVMDYDLSRFAPLLDQPGLSHPAPSTPIFPADAPEYVKWQGNRHQSPG